MLDSWTINKKAHASPNSDAMLTQRKVQWNADWQDKPHSKTWHFSLLFNALYPPHSRMCSFQYTVYTAPPTCHRWYMLHISICGLCGTHKVLSVAELCCFPGRQSVNLMLVCPDSYMEHTYNYTYVSHSLEKQYTPFSSRGLYRKGNVFMD